MKHSPACALAEHDHGVGPETELTALCNLVGEGAHGAPLTAVAVLAVPVAVHVVGAEHHASDVLADGVLPPGQAAVLGVDQEAVAADVLDDLPDERGRLLVDVQHEPSAVRVLDDGHVGAGDGAVLDHVGDALHTGASEDRALSHPRRLDTGLGVDQALVEERRADGSDLQLHAGVAEADVEADALELAPHGIGDVLAERTELLGLSARENTERVERDQRTSAEGTQPHAEQTAPVGVEVLHGSFLLRERCTERWSSGQEIAPAATPRRPGPCHRSEQ